MITAKTQRLEVLLGSLPRLLRKQGKEYSDWEAKETTNALRNFPSKDQSKYTKHQLTEMMLDLLLSHFSAIARKHQTPIPAHLRFNPLTDRIADMSKVQYHFAPGEFAAMLTGKGARPPA
jgi:hypothetical protein